MSDPTTVPRHPKAARLLTACLGLLLTIGTGVSPAAANKPTEESQAVIGRCVSRAGTLLRRPGPKKDWQVVKPRGNVSSRDLLLALPGSRAEIDTANGAARLTLAGNWPVSRRFPVLESAVELHPSKTFDLDFALRQGRVTIKNRKEKGVTRARVRFQDQSWELTLDEPGEEVAVELFGRWFYSPPDKPRAEDRPDTSVFLVVLKGEVDIKVDVNEYSLRAPPGPALFSWTSQGGSAGPTSMKELPSWARAVAATAKTRAAQAAVERLRQALAKKPVAAALAEALRSKQSADRTLAVYCLGAVDDLPALLDALANRKHPEARLAALYELRHWMGRGKDYPARLYQALRDQKYSPGQAAIVMQLLYGFSERQLARPETYALLIEYLKHNRVAIRELAYWHLVIRVPDGVDIPYDAAGDARQLERAYAQWKKRIPDGQLPGKRKPKKKD